MFEFLKPLTRGVGALGVLVGASVLPIAAHAAPADEAAIPVTASAGGEGQIIARDVETGALRAATAAEAQALHRQRSALRRSSPSETQTRSHWSGATGVRLTDDFMNYSIVMKGTDGKLVEICVEGKEAADKVVNTPTVLKSATLPTE